ncbi:MAG: hypothetical protein U9R26_05590 [Campylobacterota bacterium]|nr:hypothetical protein [Campylobacterota bacterium]
MNNINPYKQLIDTLVTSILFVLLLQGSLQAKEKRNAQETKFQNPMHKEFAEIAKKNNLDLSFTETVWAQKGKEPVVWGPNNYKINTLFHEKPKSIDILFFGDCTIAWGMIPQVIEQMTGKNVAMYAYASNVMTVKTAELFRKISDYYLKDDGVVIYSFSNWALQKDSQIVATSGKEYDEMVKWTEDDFGKFAQEDKKSSYKKIFDTYTKPAANKEGKIQYLRWDMDALTEYSPNFSLQATHSDILPKSITKHGALKNNAEAISKVFSGDEIFMVPLYSADHHYLTSRTIYYSYYQKLGFKLADMGLFMPIEDSYTMENHRHMANTGGVMMSILVGKWFNKYFADKSIAVPKEIDFNLTKSYKEKFELLIKHSPENSTIFLPKQWVDKGVVSYMKKHKRSVATALPADHRPLYFLGGTIDEGVLKEYTIDTVYTDTLGSFLKKYPEDLIVLSLRDDGSSKLSNETKQYFRDLGIKIDGLKFAGSFAALIDKGTTIAYDIHNTSEIGLDEKILSKYGIQKVVSAGSHYGNKSEIIIKGKNFSKQGRGINYVIRKKNGSIVNGFVDTYEKDQTGDSVRKAVYK